jgi:hypothetical protein
MNRTELATSSALQTQGFGQLTGMTKWEAKTRNRPDSKGHTGGPRPRTR